MPAMIGPTRRPALFMNAINAIAFGRSRGSVTRSENNACRSGISIAWQAPSSSASAAIQPKVAQPIHTSIASVNACNAETACTAISAGPRRTRSAITRRMGR